MKSSKIKGSEIFLNALFLMVMLLSQSEKKYKK